MTDDVLDQSTPWAPQTLSAVPAQPQPKITPETHPHFYAAPPTQSQKITPESHPHYFNAPEKSAAPAQDYMAIVRRRESGGNDMASSGVANGRYQF
ncbi:MAG: hypothetical protein JO234_03535, partial [Hyphomicrobiales bacterium]|nr:hypothetical protein [Hyphomicrobiales bacterium]